MLAACRPSTTGTTDAGPAASVSTTSSSAAAPAKPAPRSTEFASGGIVTLQLQKYLPIEFIAHGSWVAFSPKGEHAVVGAPGRAAFFPGDKRLPGIDPSNAAFTSDGQSFFLIQPGQNNVTNEVTVHLTSDLHVIAKIANALDPVWRNDDLVYHQGGQAFRVSVKAGGASAPKLLGPASPAFRDRPKAVVFAPDLGSMIVVDQIEHRISGVRRVAIAPSGRDALLIPADVIAKLAKKPEPIAVVAPDASRACVVGAIRSETTIWCASDDTAAEQIVSFADTQKLFTASFVSPNLLSYRLPTPGAVGVADFTKRTAATMPIPGGTTGTDLTPLPGGRLAVARDFYRLGIVDLEAKKFTPLGDDQATPKSVAGLGTDDTVFAVAGSSLEKGPGVFRVNVK